MIQLPFGVFAVKCCKKCSYSFLHVSVGASALIRNS
jgi:hypothetical protein